MSHFTARRKYRPLDAFSNPPGDQRLMRLFVGANRE
jgi:hypothetical protein